MKIFCVLIHYVGISNFIVEADTEEDAIKKAENRYKNGQKEDICGNEYEEINYVGSVDLVKGD